MSYTYLRPIGYSDKSRTVSQFKFCFRKGAFIMKFKKTLCGILSTAVVAASSSAFSALAATPQIYPDIVFENNQYWVYIRAEDFADLDAGGFHITLGSGWKLAMDGMYPDYNNLSNHVEFAQDSTLGDPNRYFFVAFANGVKKEQIVKFRVTKTGSYSISSATIKISYIEGDVLKDSQGKTIAGEEYSTPVMLKAREYIVGDADGDGRVDASDASCILTAIENHPTYSVKVIQNTFNNYFPGAKASAAPDANQNGYINNTDAEKIMDYYVDIATHHEYTGPIGTVDVYEVFQ